MNEDDHIISIIWPLSIFKNYKRNWVSNITWNLTYVCILITHLFQFNFNNKQLLLCPNRHAFSDLLTFLLDET